MPILPYREIEHDGAPLVAPLRFHYDLPILGGDANALATLAAEDREAARKREQEIEERGFRIGFAPPLREEKTMRYVIEVSIIAECSDDDDAEAVGQAAVQKLTGNTLTATERVNLRRIEEATVANVDSDFLRNAA